VNAPSPDRVRGCADVRCGRSRFRDVLVSNAGLMIVKSIVERDDAVFDRQIAVNLKGTFNGMREAARRLRSGGPIVNFTSVVGTKFELAASLPDKIVRFPSDET